MVHADGKWGFSYHDLICFAECTIAVIIKLENDAEKSLGHYAGTYERSSDVNEKPSYKLDEKAIWYNTVNWIIGGIGSLGNSNGYIFTNTKFRALTDEKNVWNYYDDEWKTAETNDIIASCTSILPGMYINFFKGICSYLRWYIHTVYLNSC